MLKRYINTCVLFLFFTPFSFGQIIIGKDASNKIKGAEKIILNNLNSSVEQVILKSDAYKTTSITTLSQVLFGNRTEDSWHLIRSEKDQIGMEHTRYQQLYKNIPIEGNVFIYHSKNGFIQSANGHFEPNISISTIPSITESGALEKALSDEKVKLKSEQLSFKKIELVILIHNQHPVLTYKCHVFSKNPLINRYLFVDVQYGKVIKQINNICTNDTNGTAHTHFSGTQTITTNNSSPSVFLTSETSRGNGIHTYNVSTNQPYSDSDNDWNYIDGDLDQFAVDVHFGTEATYDFYYDYFHRNSYNDQGGVIVSYVNDPEVGLNAYWSGSPENVMHYGNGDQDHFPVASLDVTGHELTHGVTEYSAALIYNGESGALNESFSDIFGNTIRFLNAPNNATWYIGDQLLHPGANGNIAFRNMANPNEFQNADCYNGLFFNNGDIVHYDSGIQNFWYYLLCEGGTGTNDLGNAYTVNSIGMIDAMNIAYRNLTVYLTPNSSFMDARLGAEQAAIDLFGMCSPQHMEVVHAWYAVGVGTNYAITEANANFEIAENFACEAPYEAIFSALNGYENYSWDFGDGTSSTLQNPLHTYTSNGDFTVKLIVTNTAICPSSDTLIVTNAVIINPYDPIADFDSDNSLVSYQISFTDNTTYSPSSWEWTFGDGTTSSEQNPVHDYSEAGTYTVQLIVTNCAGSDTITKEVEALPFIIMCQQSTADRPSGLIYDSGNSTNNYQDNEDCGILIQPCNVASITLTFEELNIEENWDYIYIYDGNSTAAPLIATLTGIPTVPPITSTGGSLYIQFVSDVYVTEDGFKISYTSVPNQTLMSANFSISSNTPAAGQTIQFNDLSSYFPTEWSWNFGDGSTSAEQNPTHIFASAGQYSVVLNVTFCDGTTGSYTSTVSVGTNGLDEEHLNSNELAIFPNPVLDLLHINSSEEWSEIEFEIRDMVGRVVTREYHSSLPENGISIGTADYVSGNYFLLVKYHNSTNETITAFKKFIKI